MNGSKQRWSTVTILGLALAAAAVLAWESAGDPHTDSKRAFGQLVGGLGLGPALDLGRCEFSFDPRLCGHCSSDVGIVPGGMTFCPHHGLTLRAYPSLPAK
jgi:hypothetical protein